jgi:hypothetical protein
MRKILLMLMLGAAACAPAAHPGAKPPGTRPLREAALAGGLQPPRYEIVQSNLAALGTFQLDRLTGESYLLTNLTGKNNEVVKIIFKKIPVENYAAFYRRAVFDEPRFRIFNSQLAIKFTFLIDTRTGRSWQLTKGLNGDIVWSLVPRYDGDNHLAPDDDPARAGRSVE